MVVEVIGVIESGYRNWLWKWPGQWIMEYYLDAVFLLLTFLILGVFLNFLKISWKLDKIKEPGAIGEVKRNFVISAIFSLKFSTTSQIWCYLLSEINKTCLNVPCFIILSKIELQKVIFSQIWDFRTACQTNSKEKFVLFGIFIRKTSQNWLKYFQQCTILVLPEPPERYIQIRIIFFVT